MGDPKPREALRLTLLYACLAGLWVLATNALVGTLALSVVVPFFWLTPTGVGQWLMLAALGLLGGLGHYFVARALLWGPVSVISPFHYAQLVWAAVAGFLVFGDVPSSWTWLGAAIVIGSGLYLAWRETRVP